MTSTPPLIEEDLHAYLDGELAEPRRRLVEAHLRENPQDAKRLQAYRQDGEAIARIFARAGEIPAGSRAAPTGHRAAPLGWRRAAAMPWARAAAIALVVAGTLAAGIIGLWQSRSDETLWAHFGGQALTAHLSLSAPHVRPAVTASFEEISDYLSKALKTRMDVRYPANPTYTLVGSQFIATPKGRVVQLAFQNPDGKLVTMYIEPWPGKQDAPFKEVASHSGIITMIWVDDEIGCAVSGALSPQELEQAARSLYKAMLS